MIRVENLKFYEGVPFEEYLKMPGYSYSWIKSGGQHFKPTSKMNLGSQVDDYLNYQSSFDGDIELIKPTAQVLRQASGDLYPYLKKQLSITADFIYEDILFQYKGRIDWGIYKMIVIDTKVAEDINKTIYYFDYPSQISGYCLALSAPVGIIIAVNPKTKEVTYLNIPIRDYWWRHKILKYGTPIKTKKIYLTT